MEHIVPTMLQVISFAFLYKHVFQIGFKLVQLLQAQYIESIFIWQITSSCCWKIDKAKGRCCLGGETCASRQNIFLNILLLYEFFTAKAGPVTLRGLFFSRYSSRKCNKERRNKDPGGLFGQGTERQRKAALNLSGIVLSFKEDTVIC